MEAPRALLFDVFGTCVDWYGSVTRALAGALGRPPEDAGVAALALAWRQAYFDGMAEVRVGRRPWRRVDEIHAEALERLMPEHGFALPDAAARARLNRCWHALDPWPDSVGGLRRLRHRHILATLSNGNLDLLIDLARHGGLAWDMLFCSDLFGCFKPDPQTYLGACRLLALEPGAVMMVACHRSDLQAAARHGLRTAFVARPLEYGGRQPADGAAAGDFDYVCTSFTELAECLKEAA